MTQTLGAGEAVSTRKQIPDCLRDKHRGTDGNEALGFAMDLLRVLAIALVNKESGVMSDEDILAAGYVAMYAVDALKVTDASMNGEVRS